MNIKSTSHRYFWIVCIVLLTACGSTPPAAETPTAARPATETPTALPTFTPDLRFPSPTAWLSALPLTATHYASLLTSLPSTPMPIPISTSTEIFPLDNLRMAYIVDGNLYVQNGSNPPKKLSDSGKDWYPMFSDDGEKIVFYREKNLHDYYNSIFSVNADGSHKQEIITKDWLDMLGAGTKAGHLAFVPNAHKILFNTYLCPDDDNMSSGCTVGLFLADTDTGNLKAIVKPTLGGRLLLGGDSRWGGNFSISPDGKSLSVARAGQIDILGMDGKAIHRSIMEYLPGMPIELYPRIYWFSDSSGFIAALPAEKEYYFWVISGNPAYTIWRYIFDDNVATQIPLDPTPLWMRMEANNVVSVSPNREWIVYFANDCQLYKGNLLDGKSELLLPCDAYYLPMRWSPDSIHFSSNESPRGSILGSVNRVSGYPPGYFLGWIDAKRFIYIPATAYHKKEDIPVLVGEIDGEILYTYETKVFTPPYSYFFTFTTLDK
jgi:hypothetical protein